MASTLKWIISAYKKRLKQLSKTIDFSDPENYQSIVIDYAEGQLERLLDIEIKELLNSLADSITSEDWRILR